MRCARCPYRGHVKVYAWPHTGCRARPHPKRSRHDTQRHREEKTAGNERYGKCALLRRRVAAAARRYSSALLQRRVAAAARCYGGALLQRHVARAARCKSGALLLGATLTFSTARKSPRSYTNVFPLLASRLGATLTFFHCSQVVSELH